MTDWNALIIESMKARHPGSLWAVLPGCDAPADMPVFISYPCLVKTSDCLTPAGFRLARHSIPALAMDGHYDRTTSVRYSAGCGRNVVMVRRRSRRGSDDCHGDGTPGRA